MKAEQWKKVKEAFNRAVELPAAERVFVLDQYDGEIRAEAEKMLEAIDTENLLLNEPIVNFKDFDETGMPEKIGHYKIIREIGHGGMGTVYEALREAEDFTQRVALKVIKRGMNNEIILKRFRAEQQILASLEHPNIGRFLDGGKTAEGLPFYALEFIEGKPIDIFGREKNLSVEEKVRLFREVCAAVSYAHSQLVVHRDLKPSNIIVTRNGTPKLLDFGIAKVLDIDSTDAGTATQLGMMTPQYASPEQIRGEKVTTLSDVYSLGIILYELLTEARPYQTEGKNYAEILEVITQTAPLKPSTNPKSKIQNPKLKGDLDRIVLKSLNKDPARRYQSVEQFSEDLRRHLEGLPITARPDTVGYRLSKFVGRNRVGVAAAGLIFLSLVTGIGATAWQANRAEKQRVLAEKRFSEVRAIANNVVFKYHDEIEKLNGSTAVREMLVKDATAYLDNLAEDSDDDANLERELGLAYLKLGDVQGKIYAANTGNTDGALKSYQKAINLLEKVAAARPNDISVKDDLIKANDAMAFLMARTVASSEKKMAILDKNAKLIEEILKIEPKSPKWLAQLATLYIRYGDSVGHIGDKDSLLQKLEYHQKALPVAEELLQIEPGDPEILQINTRLNQRIGTDYFWLGQNAEMNDLPDEAQTYFARALPYHEKMFQMIQNLVAISPHDKTIQRNLMVGNGAYAETLSRNGQKETALELAQKSIDLASQAVADDPHNREAKFDLAEAYNLFSRVHTNLGDYPKAIENLKKALEICQEVYKSDSGNMEALGKIGNHYLQLIKLYEMSQKPGEAEIYKRRLAEHQEFRQNLKPPKTIS